MSGKWLTVIGAVYGFLGVGLGAFGAHGLRDRLTADAMRAWETAVQYHLLHAIMLVVVGTWLARSGSSPALAGAGWAFALGTLLFSGSLYGLVTTEIRLFGPVTPLGGLVLLLGWLLLVVAAWR